MQVGHLPPPQRAPQTPVDLLDPQTPAYTVPEEVARQRALADALRMQGYDPRGGTAAGLAHMLRQYTAGKSEYDARMDKEESNEYSRGRMSDALRIGQDRVEEQGARDIDGNLIRPTDIEGAPIEGPMPGVEVEGDPSAMWQHLATSDDPNQRAIGVQSIINQQQAQQQLEQQKALQKPRTYKGADQLTRWLDGPQKGQLVDPTETVQNDPNQPFNPDGTPNEAYHQYEINKAAKIAQAKEDAKGKGGSSAFDKPTFDQEHKLRTQFTKLTKDYAAQNDAYGRIMASAKDPSAAGDLALIFNYMKLLDPGSTVREGEFANAQNSGGVPSKVRAYWNNLQRGERLDTSIRYDFLDRAQRLYVEATDGYNKRAEEATRITTDYGLDPSRVIANRQLYSTDEKGYEPPEIGTIVDGYKYIGGDPAVPENWEKQ